MSDRPFIAARLEAMFDRRVEGLFRRLGWRDAVIGYTGYGTTRHLRILARVVLTPGWRATPRPRRDEAWRERRGWRNFWSVSCVHRLARVRVGAIEVHAVTDRSGYLDVAIADHGLEPGWHHVLIDTEDGRETEARVLVVPDDAPVGLISDIDDTIIASYLPRALTAAWNYLFVTESARQPVPGMARCYREILRRFPGAPVFYVSTGAWNTLPFLDRFTLHHGFPPGPMLLSDWGPTNTGWFRSGPAHKARALRSLARDFPNVTWLLVGDDGQHDPALYAQFAADFPGRVLAIAIRELGPVEQVLAHGTPRERADTARPVTRAATRPAAPDERDAASVTAAPNVTEVAAVPEVRAPDGDELWARLAPIIGPAR
ncbi:MAG: DUF2183 domain-containing protein [Propionibacteriaceae bacterium]|jgi:phosphatidate phosphatase APP1|nr:DUF2183 domain-containing protein [Propionibacteriaceae bacterium]